MKTIGKFLSESFYDDMRRPSTFNAFTYDDNDDFPIFMLPDGKEYVLRKYTTNHPKNGHGQYHQGYKFVEAKY